MIQSILVGIGAGAAAGLLFASVASGSLFAMLLFYLAPLPIMIAAVGWTHISGIIAGITAAVGLGLVLNFYFCVAFLLCIGLPAWWLGYLALLARPVSANGAGDVEWYPIGRIVMWAAIAGALAVTISMLLIFSSAAGILDTDTIQSAVRATLERIRGGTQPPGLPGRGDSQFLIDAVIFAIPPAIAVVLTMLHIFNLWLAARIVNVSGRLRRPWPDLMTLSLPTRAPALLLAAIAGSFLPGLAGRGSGVLAASLFMAYAIMGFAVLHAITRGMSSRVFALTSAYVAVFLLSWPILAMSLLGLAETAFNIRARFTKGGPPAKRT